MNQLTLRWSELTKSPSRIYSILQPLTPASEGTPETGASTPETIARDFLNQNLALFNLVPKDISELRTSRNFKTQHNGVTHLTFQQQVNGIDVFGAVIKTNIDATGRILNLSGEAMPNIHADVNTQTPTLSAQQAIARAAENARVQSIRSSKSDGLVYFPLALDRSRLAWQVIVEDRDTPDVFWVVVDAVDGTVLWRKNLTLYDHFDAHGDVYTGDSPDPNTPTGTSIGVVARLDVPFDGMSFFPHEDPHADWWNGSGEADRNSTKSNNVRAKQDRDGDNDDTEGFVTTTDEDFSFSIDLSMEPVNYTNAAVANLFYWNNRIHDIFYRLGFDEAAGNFQQDNFGLGGSEGDPVEADAQDNRDGDPPSNCNANMSTPADGSSPRMQMYQCDEQVPERDGDLDNPVIIHEFAHGVHSRLVSGLTASQGGGMGEGWGDFFGLALLAEPGDDLTEEYEIGEWLTGSGIRREAYSTDQTVFTRTYADIVDGARCTVRVCSDDPTQACTDDDECGDSSDTCDRTGCSFQFECQPPVTSIAQGDCVAEVHNTGELWANTLWIARSLMVWKYGFSTGDLTMSLLVIDGMKLAPDGPDFLDMRDAILLADQTNNGGVNQCLLWDAFARMGTGFSALSTGPADINVIEAFDTPSTCTPNIQVSTSLDIGNVCVGDTGTSQLEIFNTATGDLVVTSVSRISGSEDITVDALPELPIFISPDAHVDFIVRCQPTGTGLRTAVIRIESNDPDEPQVDLEFACSASPPNIAIVIANEGDYGDVCIGNYADLDLLINNSGGCDLTVSDITSNDADFLLAGVMSFPLVIGPGDSLPVPIRFAPSSLGAHIATISASSDDPDEPHKKVAVSGDTPPGEIAVTGSTRFGDVCAEDLAEKTVAVCNVGLCNLTVTDASIDCPDFTLINNPFPSIVSHDFCLDLVIRFTPTSAGPKECTLSITSDDPVTPLVTRKLTANTPLASIGVPSDLSFAPTVIQNIDACETPEPFPVSNMGTCSVQITEFAIVDNTDEYSVVGLRSVPINLQPGHIVGEGDLDVVFAPHVIDRDRIGSLRVTYVSDPITGDTMSETRALCGEGVHTGARVLVTHGGQPLELVKLIKLRRMTGNNNSGPTDTVDTAKDLPYQEVMQDSPCASFGYHREYGTVSNPIQLVPGAYLVTVKAKIPGMNGFQQMTVAFDVSSCDFNPTVIVDF